MDFCPAFTTIFRFEVGNEVRVLDCTDSTLNGAWVQKKDEVFGSNSRCIEHASGSRPLCLGIICGISGRDAGKVIFDVNGRRLRCNHSGEVVKLQAAQMSSALHSSKHAQSLCVRVTVVDGGD